MFRISRYALAHSFAQKHRVHRSRSPLRSLFNLCFWTKYCTNSYQLIFNTYLSKNIFDLSQKYLTRKSDYKEVKWFKVYVFILRWTTHAVGMRIGLITRLDVLKDDGVNTPKAQSAYIRHASSFQIRNHKLTMQKSNTFCIVGYLISPLTGCYETIQQ